MWNEPFEHLRRRLTFVCMMIFGVIILLIVATAYSFIWFEIISHEKKELVAQVYHEAEEWLASGEKPCSTTSLRDGSMLAYFVAQDGKTVILDQLGSAGPGRALRRHQQDWPEQPDSTRLLRMHGDETEPSNTRYRYLAAVINVNDNHGEIGKLYMFKNIQFYYTAAYKTLFMLFCIALILFIGACMFSYWLAGVNMRPISQMYEQQKRFTADASHEMRTPLSVMRLAVDAMKIDTDSHYSSFVKESIEMLQSEIKRMSKLVEMLMQLARNEVQEFEPNNNTDIDVSSLAKKIGQEMALLAKSKHIVLTQAIAEGIHLQAAESHLQSLIIILLDNAIKYSPEKTHITLLVKATQHDVLLEVHDEGIGIADEDKKKIFERFYRVDKARSRSQGGFGLGLSLAMLLVKMYHGVIEVKDNKPCGTIFKVHLPWKKQ